MTTEQTVFDEPERARSLSFPQAQLLFWLAFIVPAVGVGVGATLGVSPHRLGGVMASYWVLMLSAGVRAYSDYRKSHDTERADFRRRRSLRIMSLACVALLAPPAVKGVGAASSFVVPSTQVNSQTAAEAKGACRTQLANPGQPLTARKQGHAGNLAWYFWVGNRYEWDMEIQIVADDASATGAASIVGGVSAWYSARVKSRTAQATARGEVHCEPGANGCVAIALSAKDVQADGDFVATVEATANERSGQAVIEVSAITAVSGVSGSTVSIGVENGPLKGGLDLTAPASAQDSMQKEKGYYFRCVKAN